MQSKSGKTGLFRGVRGHLYQPARERRGNNLKGFKDFYLNANARICPWLVLYVPSSLHSGSFR